MGKHKSCIQEGCLTRPSFNVKGSRMALYCSKHKLKDMIDVLNPICIQDKCVKRSLYNIRAKKRDIYCFKNK